MFRILVRLLLAASFAAFTTAAALAAWTAGRLLLAGGDTDAWVNSCLEPAAAACAGAALAGGLLYLFSTRRRRLLLAEVEQHLAHLRDTPSPNASAVSGTMSSADLGGVRREAQRLA